MTRNPNLPNADLHGYVLGELTAAERRQVEQLIACDAEVAQEVERLQLAQSMLRRLPEEEPPRRIAFVSDKVFEPKWYQAWWNSGARLAFAGMTMLAAAVITHGVVARPVVVTAPAAPANLEALVQARVEQELARRMEPAIAKAVAEIESKQQQKAQILVAAALKDAERKYAMERQALLVSIEENFTHLRKQLNRFYVASAERSSQ
jgi:anti-sigma-K factor RskA